MKGISRPLGIPIRGGGTSASWPPIPRMPRVVAVVNEQFAKHYLAGRRCRWASASASEQRGTLVEIVGVARRPSSIKGPSKNR